MLQEIKSGTKESIEENIRAFAQEIRDSYANRNRSIIYVQNLEVFSRSLLASSIRFFVRASIKVSPVQLLKSVLK